MEDLQRRDAIPEADSALSSGGNTPLMLPEPDQFYAAIMAATKFADDEDESLNYGAPCVPRESGVTQKI